MDRLRLLVRRRPFALSVAVLIVVAVVGISIQGIDFVDDTLPMPRWMVNIWVTCNMVFALVTLAVSYRNLLKYEDRFNWQETYVVRGICWLMLGIAIGSATRLSSHSSSITLGTPVITLGILSILYGALRDPDRFTAED